ncbi:MAG: 2Fe-2S iron-sulfur cluster binding domain-containing protein, partial [Deltaproteobacteria bacterium]|nr:2Fe-2S iron-sulfur cluster binding domain-containing protein [Deltaproteobacteria bacterium]
MGMHKVTFLPDGKEVEAEAGITLMQAAEKAGVYINSLCGGKGVCGKCRVQVINGKVLADKHSIGFLSKEELNEGFVLACQTKVTSDMEVV